MSQLPAGPVSLARLGAAREAAEAEAEAALHAAFTDAVSGAPLAGRLHNTTDSAHKLRRRASIGGNSPFEKDLNSRRQKVDAVEQESKHVIAEQAQVISSLKQQLEQVSGSNAGANAATSAAIEDLSARLAEKDQVNRSVGKKWQAAEKVNRKLQVKLETCKTQNRSLDTQLTTQQTELNTKLDEMSRALEAERAHRRLVTQNAEQQQAQLRVQVAELEKSQIQRAHRERGNHEADELQTQLDDLRKLYSGMRNKMLRRISDCPECYAQLTSV